MRSHELLAPFGSSVIPTGPVLEWLDRYRTPSGGWDLGPKVPGGVVVPFAPNWRSMGTREIDWTARVLSLLAKLLRA